MRIGGFGGTILAKLGGVPQNIPGGEIYPALEKGTIDATEWVGPYDDEKLGFHKVAKFYYYPGWWEGGPQISLYINQAAWDKLPKDYQAIVEIAAGMAQTDMLARYDAKNPAALRRLIGAGTHFVRLAGRSWRERGRPPTSTTPSSTTPTRAGRRCTRITRVSAMIRSAGPA